MRELFTGVVRGLRDGVNGFQGSAGFAIALLAVLGLMAIGGGAPPATAQTELAGVYGRVTDPSGAVIVDAEVEIRNTETGISTTVKTNQNGLYTIPSLHPGQYLINVRKPGFQSVTVTELTLNVQDNVVRNFSLQVGSVAETVTVRADDLHINTTDASVSTVIDRKFVESLPLNGRSFNTLMQLTPGVIIAPNNSGGSNQGQFSVAGQRTDANNFTIDGVSANFGVGVGLNPAQSGTGGAQAFSAVGATSNLVSVDALQEFRIETSSFAPEFGKTPGGQVILTTRSGTNEFHGGIFEYFRNSALDANDWFNNSTIDLGTGRTIPRAPEHHNDFGGVLGGPIWKDKTFFFFSYEGARLLLPQTVVNQVPSNNARAVAPAPLAPYLNAYPKPNGPISADGNTAQFVGSLSNPAHLDATSIRIDHTFNPRYAIFARFNDAPSHLRVAFGSSVSLSNPTNSTADVRTLTTGLNMAVNANASNTFRANYSTQNSAEAGTLNSFGGAVPLSPGLLLGTLPVSRDAGYFQTFDIASYNIGNLTNNKTRQLNFTDTLTLARHSHLLKFGVDYRSILLDEIPFQHQLLYLTSDVGTFLSTGTVSVVDFAIYPSQFLAQSVSLFAQDTWKVMPRLTLTYGLRWELSPAPSARGKTMAATWLHVDDPANLALAPQGTPLWATTYRNFAPRLGVAYSLSPSGDLVIRVGGGMFYDLGVGDAASLAYSFPNAASVSTPAVSLPVRDISPFLATNFSRQPPYGGGYGFDPQLVLPRSYQWNLAIEKSFAGKYAISATYVGQAGRDNLRKATLFQPNSNFSGDFIFTNNSAYSNYHALQMQFRKSLSSRLQALLNYTWSHSLDNASDDVTLAIPGNIVSGLNDYASSSFDVRHSFSGAVTYDLPAMAKSGVLAILTGHWSLQAVVVARTGFPFNSTVTSSSPDPTGLVMSRPDRVLGKPVWISDPTAPGGQSLNAGAFVRPLTPRQGTEGRNDIPGFGFRQIDLSLGRKFLMGEKASLQFRADAFNLFNHPNFRNPSGNLDLGSGGLMSFEMLNQGLGGLNPLFQEGGPRSLQLSLKMSF